MKESLQLLHQPLPKVRKRDSITMVDGEEVRPCQASMNIKRLPDGRIIRDGKIWCILQPYHNQDHLARLEDNTLFEFPKTLVAQRALREEGRLS